MTIDDLLDIITAAHNANKIDEHFVESLGKCIVPPHFGGIADPEECKKLMQLQVVLQEVPAYEVQIWELLLNQITPIYLPDGLIEYFYKKHIAIDTLGHMELSDKWLTRFGKYVDEAILTLGKRIYKGDSYSANDFAEFLAEYKNMESLLHFLLVYCKSVQNAKRSCLFWVCSKHVSTTIREECASVIEMERCSLSDDPVEIEKIFNGCNDPMVLVGLAQNVHTPLSILEELSKIHKVKNAVLIRNEAKDIIRARERLSTRSCVKLDKK